MRVFFDTSAIFKLFITEKGSDKIALILQETTSIFVAPTCWLEVNSTVQRLLNQKTISADMAQDILQTMQESFASYHIIIWNSALEERACSMIQKHQLKSLDAIQLASALQAQADLFVTSDKTLFTKSQTEMKSQLVN